MTIAALSTLSAISGLIVYILWTVDADRRGDRLRRQAGERAQARATTAEPTIPPDHAAEDDDAA